MKSSKPLALFSALLFLLNANTAFAEGGSYKCSSSNEIQQSLTEEEICSDLDITNKNKLSSCLQRKYISVENELDSVYKGLIAEPEESIVKSQSKNEVLYFLSLIKKKPANLSSFINDKQPDRVGLDTKKKDELVKEQAAWRDNLLYNCMEAANEVKNDPLPLLVIKGCLISKTEERLAYLNGLL